MLHNGSYTYAYFFWTLSPIKMKFGQILVCCMTNISNVFLAECWRLETSSRLFYDFIKTTTQQDLTIFNGWHIPFLIVLYSPFQKNKHWNPGIFGYWVLGAGCLIEKPQSPRLFKRLLKIIVLAYIYQLANFGDFICGSKDVFKNAPYLMY